MNRKQIRAAALLVALLSLTGCGKKGGQEDVAALPTEYSFEGESIVALATEEEGVQFSQAKTVTYHYDGLSTSGRTAASYTAELVSSGFTVVDEDLVKTDRPDFDAEEGMVRLAKDVEVESEETEETEEADGEESEEPEPEEPKVTLIVLNWSEGTCSVTIDEMAGTVTYPPPEETVGAVSMTLSEAVDYIRNLPPAVLGLSGDSMGNYQIYAQEGSVLVGGYACLRLNVYSTDNPAHTNQFMGSFLMTSDGQHLYRSDVVAGTVEELKLP